MRQPQIKLTSIHTTEDFQILDIYLTGNGIIEPNSIRNLDLPRDIDYSKGVLINGRAPIWLYTYLAHELHPASYVAIYDPRLGGIIVQSHKSGTPAIGTLIPNDKIINFLPHHEDIKKKGTHAKPQCKVIAFIGPPHSGKSVLIYQLNNYFKNIRKNTFFQRDFFILKGCPDGEGIWCNDTQQPYVSTIKYKNRFDDQFVSKVVGDINSLKLSKSLVFVDCGGLIDNFNQRILNHCTHAIIVSGQKNDIPQWIGAAKASNLEIIAVISSKLKNISHIIKKEPLTISLGPLERSNDNLISIPKLLLEKIFEV